MGEQLGRYYRATALLSWLRAQLPRAALAGQMAWGCLQGRLRWVEALSPLKLDGLGTGEGAFSCPGLADWGMKHGVA